MTAPAATPVRSLAGVRLIYGSALLLAPDAVLAERTNGPIDRRAVLVARVLGARQIVQAVVVRRKRSRGWILGGVAIDATHAATMLLLALNDRRRRTLATANALGATAFALVGLRQARRM